jgi:hypothetical protein
MRAPPGSCLLWWIPSQQRDPPPSLDLRFFLRAQVVKLAHDLCFWRGQSEGHIRFTGAAGPPLFRLASPRLSHWSAQSWAAPFKEANCTPPPPPPPPPSTPPHHTIQRAGTWWGRQARIKPAGAWLLRWGSLPAAARDQIVDRIWPG